LTPLSVLLTRTGKLGDKIILITGTSSGIEIETARALKVTGAHLFLTARNLSKAREALGDILEPGKVDLLLLDLNSLASVRKFADEFITASNNKLNILINNAGVMATPDGTTEDGFKTQFGTNYLAHFLLFQLIKPALLAASRLDF
jgi:NAD(P)-dependent dehydrogenase (short-subunit alcohol dehydrogenase family)